jgi:uncharacterized protein YlxP (DUF503 family)
MTVGILRLVLYIHDSNSLKEKRMFLHSLKARIRNNFNVAVSQIDDEDKWQKTTLAIVGVERDGKSINSILSKVVNFTQDSGKFTIIEQEMELI